MTRSDIIARIREIETRMGLSPLKGLSRTRKAELQADLDHLMYRVEVAAHEENDRRAASLFPVGELVTVAGTPGVWEISQNAADYGQPEFRHLRAVDSDAKKHLTDTFTCGMIELVSSLTSCKPGPRYVVTSTFHPEIRDDLYGVKDTFTGEQIMSDIWGLQTSIKVAVQHNDGWREDVAQGRATLVVWPSVDHDLVTV